MSEKVINGKAIYSPKGAAREYSRVGCNFYAGCPHNCSYCYLKRGVLSHVMGGTEVKLKSCFDDLQDAYDVFLDEMAHNLDYLRQTGIFFSFSTDPLLEETRDLTLDSAIVAASNGINVKILTKAADADWWLHYIKGITKRARSRIAFGFTLTGCDEMELGAPSNHERIEAMRKMYQAGHPTFASIEPVVDVKRSVEMIRLTFEFCDLYLIGLRSGVKKDYYRREDIGYLYSEVMAEHDYRSEHNFKVYCKESVRKFFKENEWEFLNKPYFVESDYNMFNPKNEKLCPRFTG